MTTKRTLYRARIVAALAAVPALTISTYGANNVKRESLIRSDFGPGEVTRLCEQVIQEAEKRIQEIVGIPSEKRNVKNTLLAFEEAMADLEDKANPLTFMGHVSTQEAISKEGIDCEQKVEQFGVSVMTRKDLYDAIRSQKKLTIPQKRLLTQTLKAFEDNGLKLPADRLEEVKKLKQELVLKQTQFSSNLNQDKTVVEFTREELEGLPEDFLQGLGKTSQGKYIVTTKTPDFIRVMDNATRSETRRRMLSAYENRASTNNTQLLKEAIEIRQKLAKILGFENWVDYRTHTRMAKDSKTVMKFLNELKEKLAQRNQEDMAKLLKLKREMDPSARDLKSWDIRYFSNQLKKKELKLDDEAVREYFPADLVIPGMFQIYSTLLGVQYVEQTDAPVWAEGVKLYQIQDNKTKKTIGYFYTDFFPRTGKYGHAAAFTLISGRNQGKDEYSQPVSAIVANFTPPMGAKPSLLKPDEVRTLFHEFGHIMHQTLTRAPFASLSGSRVARDFVEAPSQMLENWVYSPKILELISGHYKDHSKKLPKEMLEKLIESRDFNQGYFYTRQLVFALLDMNFHLGSAPVDPTSVYNQLYKELIGVEPMEDGHFPASFGHLMGGYDAGYYGYLWSDVYAEDMFTQFEKQGLLNATIGMKYRKYILEKGDMEEASDLVRKFLGRKPNPNAFYKKLNISVKKKK